MERNEPSTAEIVQALRCSADDDSFCKKCQYGYALGSAFLCDKGRMNGNAADRLEQLERDLEAFKAFHERYAEQTSKKYVDDICALTARAESAERERDAAIKELEVIEQDGLCSICKFESTIPLMECMENCVFKWRGKPKEGEGTK